MNSQREFIFTIYAPQNELELINFNISENFHVASNNTLLADYTLYYFQVEYFGLKGTLKGLSIENSNLHNLDEDKKFKVTDEIGLIYK